VRLPRCRFPAFLLINLWFLTPDTVWGQSLPTSEQFNDKVIECAVDQKIALHSDVIEVISDLYSAQRPTGAKSFQSAADFLELMPRIPAFDLKHIASFRNA
jgi:hypothetical protein